MVIETKDVRFEEKTLKKTIGSTAQGVGAATARRVLRGAWGNVRLASQIRALRPFIRQTRQVLDDAFFAGKRILLEGTQGTGLSLFHGDFPHVTSRDTTVSGCLAEAGIAPSRVRKIIMVCRTYPIRVQNPADSSSGHMTNELTWAEIARRSGISAKELRFAEKTSTTRRRRRVAEFDWSLIRRAASLNGPTDIALTFADYVDVANRSARRFELLTDPTIRMIEEIERVTSAPVSLIATRFHHPSQSIIDRRAW
jgi:adenylosuccinate synthase